MSKTPAAARRYIVVTLSRTRSAMSVPRMDPPTAMPQVQVAGWPNQVEPSSPIHRTPIGIRTRVPEPVGVGGEPPMAIVRQDRPSDEVQAAGLSPRR